MPVHSKYPEIDIPNIDLWTLLLDKKNQEFPNEKGISGLQVDLDSFA